MSDEQANSSKQKLDVYFEMQLVGRIICQRAGHEFFVRQRVGH